MSAVARAARFKRRPMSIEETSRQLRRASLGMQYSLMVAASDQRMDEWVDSQFAIAYVPDQMLTTVRTRRLPGFAEGPVLNQYWQHNYQYMNWKLYQPEVLRVKLAYAMNELFSVGGVNSSFEGTAPMAVLWDILESAIGEDHTFLQLITNITRSQTMAKWLTYWKNAKTDGTRQPDENYAREVMQLYTVGLYELHMNGTRKLRNELDPGDPRYIGSGEGSTDFVPIYGQEDIANMARVFTGLVTYFQWGPGDIGTLNDMFASGWFNIGNDGAVDLEGRTGWAARLNYAPGFHETSLPKVALQGRVNIPVGTDGDTSLNAALTALVNHPSCAPYLAGRFINMLTSSNPSPEYVARVASAFVSSGGKMRALFKAILCDQEVLAPESKDLTMRVLAYEELVLSLVLAHPPALTAEGAAGGSGAGVDGPPGSNDFQGALYGMDGVSPFLIWQNPSVFGRYPAQYSAAGEVFNAGLKSPELATLTEGSLTDLIDQSQTLYERIGNVCPNQDRLDAMTTGNRVALVNRLDRVLTGATTTQEFKDTVLAYMATRGEYFDTQQRAAETYWQVAAMFWLSPWGISRK